MTSPHNEQDITSKVIFDIRRAPSFSKLTVHVLHAYSIMHDYKRAVSACFTSSVIVPLIFYTFRPSLEAVRDRLDKNGSITKSHLTFFELYGRETDSSIEVIISKRRSSEVFEAFSTHNSAYCSNLTQKARSIENPLYSLKETASKLDY